MHKFYITFIKKSAGKYPAEKTSTFIISAEKIAYKKSPPLYCFNGCDNVVFLIITVGNTAVHYWITKYIF
jgi:hypothetical protein